MCYRVIQEAILSDKGIGITRFNQRYNQSTILKNKMFQRKFVNIFLPKNFSICIEFSKEPSP